MKILITLTFLLSLFLTMSISAFAETNAPREENSDGPGKFNKISVGLSIDEDRNRTYIFNSHLTITEWLSLSGSFSKNTSNSDDEATDTDATVDDTDYSSIYIGPNFSIGEYWEWSFYFDQFGSADTLLARGGGTKLTFLEEKWSLSLGAARRNLSILFNGNLRTTHGDEISLGLSLLNFLPFYFEAEYRHYKYQADLTRLSSDAALRVLPTSILSLSTNFNNWLFFALVGYEWSDFRIEVSFTKLEAAVDLSIVDATSLLFGHDVTSRWSYELEISNSKVNTGADSSANTGTESKIISASLGFSW